MCIFKIDGGSTFLTYLRVGRDRLTAAAQAAAGTGHDLDEAVGRGTVFYLIEQESGILQCVGNSHLQYRPVQIDIRLFDSLQPTDRLEIDTAQFLPGI